VDIRERSPAMSFDATPMAFSAAHTASAQIVSSRLVSALRPPAGSGRGIVVPLHVSVWVSARSNKFMRWAFMKHPSELARIYASIPVGTDIPGATAKDKETRRIPFNPNGRLAAILKRRATLGSEAYVFGSTHGAYQPTIHIGPKCRLENARPDADLRWRSKPFAKPASATSIATTTAHGR
jgi:hypothetical protein